MPAPLLALSMPGTPEMVFLLVIVLLLFGAKKLPELARGFGKSLGEFKKGREECARDVSSPGIEEAPAKPPHTPA